MKRMFLSMLAAVTLFASCSQEEVVSQQQATGEESLVSFTLITPELGSRAAATEFNGDGKLATDLYYAVYDETIGEIVKPISVNNDTENEVQKKTIAVGTKETITLPLLNGHKYSLIFWAENADCPYTVNWDEKTIALDANASLKNNQEVYDAFYAYVEPFVVSGPKTGTVELKRPFAQLNIATSQRDLGDVVDYYGLEDIKQTQIEVTTATTMDLVTGATSGSQALTYALNDFSGLLPQTGLFPTAETIDVEYVAISLNYLLVSAEKELVDIKMSCGDGTNAQTDLDRVFKNVPVQRNYRTNIYGNLYTSPTNWEVEIKPGFDGNYEPESLLAVVFGNGGEVILEEDVEVGQSLVVSAGVNTKVDLNGKTIENTSNSEAFGEGEAIVSYGNLTLEGEGTVKANSMAVWARGDNNAEITINGGTYIGLADGLAKGGRSVIYASGGNTINIYGGTFQALTADKTSFANKPEGVYPALNVADNNGMINVYGGTFINFDPANPGTEPAAWNTAHPNGFVADGYKSVKDPNANIWYVVKDEVEVATTADALSTALSSTTSNEVAMVKDVEITSTVTMVAGATLEGQGNTVTMTKNKTQTIFAPSEGGTIKNLNIKGYNERNEKNEVIRGILETDIAGDLTLENVNISGVAYPINIQASKGFAATHSLTATGSTFTGWTSYTGLTSASFTDCTFAVGTYFDSTVAGQETWNGCIKPYVTSTFTGCEFGEGFVLDLSALKTNATLTFESCTVNGVALTALSQLGVNATDTRVTIK